MMVFGLATLNRFQNWFQSKAVARGIADPMFPTQIRSLTPRLMLLKDPDDLVFPVPALIYRSPSVQIMTQHPKTPPFRSFPEAGQPHLAILARRRLKSSIST